MPRAYAAIREDRLALPTSIAPPTIACSTTAPLLERSSTTLSPALVNKPDFCAYSIGRRSSLGEEITRMVVRFGDVCAVDGPVETKRRTAKMTAVRTTIV